MKHLRMISKCLLITVCLPAQHAAALTLQIDDDGQLLGASGVQVFGQLYDVSFIDGSCAVVFDGCDETSDFTFAGINSVEPQAALRDQVLLNVAQGMFDTSPALTNGCNNPEECILITPTTFQAGGDIGGFLLLNTTDPANMFLTGGFGGLGPSTDTSDLDNFTWAKWTPTPIPAPASLLLMISAVGTLGGLGRSAQRKLPA